MRERSGLVKVLERGYNRATGRVPDLASAVATRLGRFAPADRLLDLGAGEGRIGVAIAHRTGGRVVLCDRNATKLRRPSGAWAVVADGAALPFRAQAFAAAVLVDVVHHLERPAPVLAELARVVRPDARIVVLDYQPTSGLTRVLRLLRPFVGHRCYFRGPGEVAALGSRAGLATTCTVVDGHEYACVLRVGGPPAPAGR
jgi:SAM-dependent methyltransferase